ncbi:unnamed protein product [Peronospora belbahrii]|uniref:Phosphatidylinositol-3-phosphatase n=1 Tax=Peronospora belbahrii TaxID=622444 RepID=A0ABN8CNH8_9STRA|nr:unnamed protein product [Peronospora belbahrii]
MVFQIDATGIIDPLTARTTTSSSIVNSSSSWSQYFTDETLLEEIKKDLERLYPTGNESLFQNEVYMTTLRHVLFVWCRLHPDVAYRQGMHDVVAVVLYALIENQETDMLEVKQLPASTEADTFLLFEAVMLFLKPFYEIVEARREATFGVNEDNDRKLCSNFVVHKNDNGNGFFDMQSFGTIGGKQKPSALQRLCHHIQRAAVDFPVINMTEKSDNDLLKLPKLIMESEETTWTGFPLLRYVCVAKLLQISTQLRDSDNTDCLRLLMRACQQEDLDCTDTERQKCAMKLIQFARILQDPTAEGTERSESNIKSDDELRVLDPDGGSKLVEVVLFQSGSLGIVLTKAEAPYNDRLAVKAFTKDPTTTDGMGQAEASGRVHLGDLLQSINGVPIIGLTTEEAKRRIQLVKRPIYIAFSRCRNAFGDDDITPLETSGVTKDSNAAGSPPYPETTLTELVQPTFLPGELCYASVESSMQRLTLSHDGSCLSHYISGKLFITNYRCLFTRLLGGGKIEWQIPVLSILSIDRINPRAVSASLSVENAQVALGFAPDDLYKIVIRCKDTQVARLSIADQNEYEKLVECLSFLAFPKSLLDAFCFSYSPTVAPSEEVRFDIREEYKRIGLLAFPDHLRCIDQSLTYTLCDTYPRYLIVPSGISDIRLKAAAAFRSHQRLPVVCWIHRGNSATIVRSSQPLVGFKSSRNEEDELLSTGCCGLGKGTEISSNYHGAKIIFMNVENIHSVRQSQLALAATFAPKRGATEDTSSSIYGRIDRSGWLRHVRLVLKASVDLAHTVHNGTSVLTHCSDGWDRTAQMVALAELMLDTYYRTLRGFQVLVEKEWCAFGHQFALRSGHARSDVSNDQHSPVFLLWLDCVWQFIRQYPTECEFNESVLLAKLTPDKLTP